MTRLKRNKFKNIKSLNKSISKNLIKVIESKRRELQRKENIEFGRRGQTVNFQFASDKIAERFLK